MIDFKLDENTGIAVLKPLGKLEEDDFAQAANKLDFFIEQKGSMRGLILHSREFPGWENLNAFKQHINFVRQHHKKINRIAVVTDSKLAKNMKLAINHFVSAEVEVFPYDNIEQAKQWVTQLSPVTG